MTTKHWEFLSTYSPGNGKPLEILFPRSGAPWSSLDEGDFIWATFNTRCFQGSRWRDSESYPASPFGAPAPETVIFAVCFIHCDSLAQDDGEFFPSFLPFTSRCAVTKVVGGRHCACLKLKDRGSLQACNSRVGIQLWQAFYIARVIKGGSVMLLKDATENRMLASLATLLSN